MGLLTSANKWRGLKHTFFLLILELTATHVAKAFRSKISWRAPSQFLVRLALLSRDWSLSTLKTLRWSLISTRPVSKSVMSSSCWVYFSYNSANLTIQCAKQFQRYYIKRQNGSAAVEMSMIIPTGTEGGNSGELYREEVQQGRITIEDFAPQGREKAVVAG